MPFFVFVSVFLSLSMTDRNGLTKVLLGQKNYIFHKCCSAYNGVWVNLNWTGLGMPGESVVLRGSGKTRTTRRPTFTRRAFPVLTACPPSGHPNRAHFLQHQRHGQGGAENWRTWEGKAVSLVRFWAGTSRALPVAKLTKQRHCWQFWTQVSPLLYKVSPFWWRHWLLSLGSHSGQQKRSTVGFSQSQTIRRHITNPFCMRKKKAVTKSLPFSIYYINVKALELHFVANTQKLPKLENFQFPFQTLLDQQIFRNDRYEITTTHPYVYMNVGNVHVNIHALVY